MQQLKVFQSLWAMEQRIPCQSEDPPEVWLDRIAEAGFDGVCVDPSVAEIDDTLALQPLIEARGLGLLSCATRPAWARFVVDLDRTATARMPEPHEIVIAGVALSRIDRVESPAFPSMLYLLMQGGFA